MAAYTSFLCPLCSFSSTTLKLYVSHLRVVHAKDPKFSIICGVAGCREVFRAFSAFNSHIYRHHRCEVGVDQVGKGNPFTADPLPESMSLPSTRCEHESFCDTFTETTYLASADNMQSTSCRQSVHASECDRTVSAAKMLLELREGHQVSQVAIADVANCRQLCNEAVDALKTDLLAALNAGGKSAECIELVLKQEYDPFRDIATNHRFEKFCVDHLGCLVSVYVAWCIHSCSVCTTYIQSLQCDQWAALSLFFRKLRKSDLVSPTTWIHLLAISIRKFSGQIRFFTYPYAVHSRS